MIQGLMKPLEAPSEEGIMGCRTAQLICLGALMGLMGLDPTLIRRLEDPLPEPATYLLQAGETNPPRRGCITGYDAMHHTLLEVILFDV
jgi:hypothetical protein